MKREQAKAASSGRLGLGDTARLDERLPDGGAELLRRRIRQPQVRLFIQRRPHACCAELGIGRDAIDDEVRRAAIRRPVSEPLL